MPFETRSPKVIVAKGAADEFVAETIGLTKAHQVAPKSLTRYFNDPVAFVMDMFDWSGTRPNGDSEKPTDYQIDIMEILVNSERHREAVFGPRGLGKSAVDSWLVLWFSLTRDAAELDWKIPITAGSWKPHLVNYLWPEIHKWARRLRWDKIGRPSFDTQRELLANTIKLRFGEVFSFSPKNPALAEGAHATQLFFLFDESKAIIEGLFDACEGAFSQAGLGGDYDAFALATSSPGPPLGRFYEICSYNTAYADWAVRPVTYEECLKSGTISERYAADRKRQWGVDSPMYQSQILGHFAAEDAQGVIPYHWVLEATERWNAWSKEFVLDHVDAIGVDVATEQGGDNTVFALREGDCLAELRRYPKVDTMQAVGYLLGLLEKWPKAKAIVDVIGVGTGPFDRLKEHVEEKKIKPEQIVPFNAGSAAKDSRGNDLVDMSGELKFLNKRAAAWWGLRERLDPARDSEVMLPNDPKLIGDLVSPQYHMTSAGKLQVEDKGHIRQRLQRSTDDGDACIQAFWDEPYSPPAAGVSVDSPSVIGPERRSRVW